MIVFENNGQIPATLVNAIVSKHVVSTVAVQVPSGTQMALIGHGAFLQTTFTDLQICPSPHLV